MRQFFLSLLSTKLFESGKLNRLLLSQLSVDLRQVIRPRWSQRPKKILLSFEFPVCICSMLQEQQVNKGSDLIHRNTIHICQRQCNIYTHQRNRTTINYHKLQGGYDGLKGPSCLANLYIKFKNISDVNQNFINTISYSGSTFEEFSYVIT